MTIMIIHEALRAYIDPLTEQEFAALERSILTEGCRDALVCWGEVLIDGHNRYAICQQHALPFKIVQNEQFANIEDVQLWMIDNHLGRRSVSDFQRGMLAIRKKEIITARLQLQESAAAVTLSENEVAQPIIKATQSRQDIARAAGITSNAVVQIEKIQRTAAPELVRAVRNGTISISAAAAVASLPEAEQVAAVAGGRKELQQVAKQIRDKARAQKSPTASVPEAEAAPTQTTTAGASGHSSPWHDRVSELESANAVLHARIAELEAALELARAA
ncbi:MULTISPECIES: hypothetical protein [unclassified Undibacterium]|uniref:hypothetical protein n=1 Tax=unclassified Undibacterium TaxID=2630295 RepID=UPI002AC9059C|nr:MULTISPECIES: hypothetical protein [unclassified Undibacterium]MEB0138426.1 hypothetical protein [Undibacterium sp. CCC2.1]MEB0171301.1 hypothetical protein [Undibacterium sp. CCC1.1]MEB0176461.1 hypothetical protein [Undibacterium sp. CCC3.4]MEB0214055.1 hypothetical protein [Undibacterium sp. 5I2]WPX43668.1 hypothetical protein RHM61_00055 [Undibacterium sp. CCC3.4]